MEMCLCGPDELDSEHVFRLSLIPHPVLYTHTHTHMRTDTHANIHTKRHLHTVCIQVFILKESVPTHTHMCTHTHVHTHAHTHMCTHTHTCAHTHTFTQALPVPDCVNTHHVYQLILSPQPELTVRTDRED